MSVGSFSEDLSFPLARYQLEEPEYRRCPQSEAELYTKSTAISSTQSCKGHVSQPRIIPIGFMRAKDSLPYLHAWGNTVRAIILARVQKPGPSERSLERKETSVDAY